MQGDIQGDMGGRQDTGGYRGIQGDTGARNTPAGPLAPADPDPLEQARLTMLEAVRLAALAQEYTRESGYAQIAREYEQVLWRHAQARLQTYASLLEADA
jgi:hypothetical protein